MYVAALVLDAAAAAPVACSDPDVAAPHNADQLRLIPPHLNNPRKATN
jgi:hypothetical protein